jgi:hypothetical protein
LFISTRERSVIVKYPNRLPGDAEQAVAETPKMDQPVAQEGSSGNSAGSRTPRPGMGCKGTPAGKEANPTKRACD